MSKKNLIIVILFLSATFIFPQQEPARKTLKILGISVQGNNISDANTIVFNSGLKIGQDIEIPGEQTINAIKNLWNLGIFNDIQIIQEKVVGNGVYLLIKVKEAKKLETVVYEGNDELSVSDLEKKVSIASGQTLKDQDLYTIRYKIKAAYEEESYLRANVETILYEFESADTVKNNLVVLWRNINDPSDKYQNKYDLKKSFGNILRRIKDRVILKIKIDEGDVVKVEKIQFRGNKAFSDDDLL